MAPPDASSGGAPSKDLAPQAQLPELKAELVKELRPIVPRESLERATQAVMNVVVSETFHAGPLPPARELARYNEIIPNGAERIMAMAEREQAIDHELARRAFIANTAIVWFGLVSAFVLSAGFIAAGVYCATIGREWAAVAMVGLGAAGIVTAFLKVHGHSGAPPPPQPKAPSRTPSKKRNSKKS